jgi:hypothetical protein
MQVVKITGTYVTGGRVFRTNEEYELFNSIVKTEGCSSCGGGRKKNITYYNIVINGTTYQIHEKVAVIISKNQADTVMSAEETRNVRATAPDGDVNWTRDYKLTKENQVVHAEQIYNAVNNIQL